MILGSVILAGGRSLRMGQPKAGLPFGDSTLLGHVTETLLACTYPVVVVARDQAQELPPINVECEIVFDASPDQGPLAGLEAGIAALADRCDAVFATGCDTPFISAEVVAALASQLGEHDLVIARVDGLLQPMGAIYRTRILPAIAALRAAGGEAPWKLAECCAARILTEAEVASIDPDRRFLISLDSPEDYEDALRQAASAP